MKKFSEKYKKSGEGTAHIGLYMGIAGLTLLICTIWKFDWFIIAAIPAAVLGYAGMRTEDRAYREGFKTKFRRRARKLCKIVFIIGCITIMMSIWLSEQ